MKAAIFASTIIVFTATAFGQWEWTAPVSVAPVSQENYHDTTPAVAVDSDGAIAVAWVQQNVTGTSVSLSRQSNILVSYSNDQGQSWAQPDVLSSPNHYDGEVDIAAGQAGEFLITWTSGDYFSEYRLHTARTTDSGQVYELETITGQNNAFEFDHISPQVAFSNGTVILAKSSWDLVPNQVPNVNGLIWSRDDTISTWTETANADSPEISHNYKTISVDLAADTTSHVLAIFQRKYYDGATYRDRIAALTSADAGLNWVNRGHITGIFGHIKDGAVAADGNGGWILAAVGENAPFSAEPIHLFKSDNNGTSWSITISVPPPAGSVNYFSFPSIATDKNGTWIVVCHGSEIGTSNNYLNDGEILYTLSTDNGITWTPLEAIESSPETDTAIETAPQVAYLGSGKWGIFYSRADNEFVDSDIVMAVADTGSSSVNDWQIY